MQNVCSLSSNLYSHQPSAPNLDLIMALRQQNLKKVTYLVEVGGASLTVQDNNGNLPLHVAVIVGFLPTVSYLLGRGADQKAPNRDGKTALQLAQASNNQALVLMLSREQAKDLPKDVLLMIFDRLSETDLGKCRRVCRQWNVIGRDERVAWKFEYAFGARAWYRHFGRVGVEPPLPADIYGILTGPCPFWEGKKVYETHLLVLIPEKVNGKPFTLDSLGKIIEEPKLGHATKYRLYDAKKDHGSKEVLKGYWVLMTWDVLPRSRNKAYSEQKQLVGEYRGYEVPKLLEVATSILVEHVKTGKKMYGDDPWTFTRCQEQATVYQGLIGGFSSEGLCIQASSRGRRSPDNHGVGATRKF